MRRNNIIFTFTHRRQNQRPRIPPWLFRSLKSKKWIPALNRFKNVLENYETTVYVEEALFRLVETNYKIGLVEESKKYANLLGYNYGSSEWYKASYKIFNQDYKYDEKQLKKNKQKDKKKILSRFKAKFKTIFE